MQHLQGDEESLLDGSRAMEIQGVVETFQGSPKDCVGHEGASAEQKNVSRSVHGGRFPKPNCPVLEPAAWRSWGRELYGSQGCTESPGVDMHITLVQPQECSGPKQSLSVRQVPSCDG